MRTPRLKACDQVVNRDLDEDILAFEELELEFARVVRKVSKVDEEAAIFYEKASRHVSKALGELKDLRSRLRRRSREGGPDGLA